MAEKIIGRLKELQQKLDLLHSSILSEHAILIKFLNSLSMNALKTVSSYKDICSSLIEELEAQKVSSSPPDKKFYNFTNWIVPKFHIDKSIYAKNLYKFEDLTEPFNWEKEKVNLYCGHKNPKLFTPRCGQNHCKKCLKALIKSNQSICPCGQSISKKDEHSLIGFPSRIQQLRP